MWVFKWDFSLPHPIYCYLRRAFWIIPSCPHFVLCIFLCWSNYVLGWAMISFSSVLRCEKEHCVPENSPANILQGCAKFAADQLARIWRGFFFKAVFTNKLKCWKIFWFHFAEESDLIPTDKLNFRLLSQLCKQPEWKTLLKQFFRWLDLLYVGFFSGNMSLEK